MIENSGHIRANRIDIAGRAIRREARDAIS